MTDVFSSEKRSWLMGRVRSTDTFPELAVRSFLHAKGFRFRLRSRLPGRPDIVLPRYRVAVFVHGCFWHGHRSCRKGRQRPASNQAFWNLKIQKTIVRDRKALRDISRLGWTVVTVWECQVKDPKVLMRVFAGLFDTRSASSVDA